MPPVLFVTNGGLREGVWVGNTTVQESTFETKEPVFSFDWHDGFTLKQQTGTGQLFGRTEMSVKGRFGKIVTTQTIEHGYDHYGGWPFFISYLDCGASNVLYVKGDYGTSYAWRASATSQFTPGLNQTYNNIGWRSDAYGFARPGWLYYWRESDLVRTANGSDQTVDRYGTPIVYRGQIYTPVIPQSSFGTGSSIGNTGPGQPPFLISGTGTYTYTVEVWLNRGIAPVTDFNSTGQRVGQPVTLESISYDPDNEGIVPHRGILLDEWEITSPDGKLSYLEGQETVFTPSTSGNYVVKLTSTDDEGMTSVKQSTLKVDYFDLRLNRVIDLPDPNNPEIEFEVLFGVVDAVEWKLGSTRQLLIGPFSVGKHRFKIPNLMQYQGQRNTLSVIGSSAGFPSKLLTTIVDQTYLQQKDKKGWALYVLVSGLGLRTAVATIYTEMYKWEWGLLGASYNRRIIQLNNMLQTNINYYDSGGMEFSNSSRVGFSVLNSSRDSFYPGKTVDSLDNKFLYTEAFKSQETSVFAKTGLTKITFTLSGATDATPWQFLPTLWDEVTYDYSIR